MQDKLRYLLEKSAIYIAIFVFLCLISQILSGGYSSDRGQTSDEAAHFVTSLMVFDYFFHHAGANPMNFALDYYAHFPRVAIGHWPPLFEVTQAVSFLFGRNGATAIALQALIAGLFAGLPAAAVARREGPILGLAAGCLVFFSPYALFLTNAVMADNFLAVLIFVAGLTWHQFYKRRTWRSGLIFAAAASAAVLTKGSAFALALLPPVYLLIKRDILAILDVKVIASAIIVGCITIPWYLLTYKYAEDGFNYSWGWNFTSIALPKYILGIIWSLGIPISFGYIIGLYKSIFKIYNNIDIYVAISISVIVFDFIVPVDITPRYLIPAIPSVSIVSICGICSAVRRLPYLSNFSKPTHIWIVTALTFISIVTVFKRPHVESFYSSDVVDLIEKQNKKNPLVLVSGSVLAEGSIIAAFAERENIPNHYVVRGTKVLASGDFMGSIYKARFQSSQDMEDWILGNQIGYVVVSNDPDGEKLSHRGVLQEIIDRDSLNFRNVGYVKNKRGGINVYALPAADMNPSPSNDVFSDIALHK